jgi:hypothetical protein
MIQRIQSIYLLLTTIASSLFLTGGYLNLINGTGFMEVARYSGVYKVSAGGGMEILNHLYPVPLIAILIPVIAFISIFLFNNRRLQKQITLLCMFLEAVMIILAAILLMPEIVNNSATLKPGYRILMPLLSMVFLYLAYAGIKKDDELVKSYDRLR